MDLSSLYPHFEAKASIKLKELVTEIFCHIAESNNTNLSLSKLIITHTRLDTLSPELLTR